MVNGCEGVGRSKVEGRSSRNHKYLLYTGLRTFLNSWQFIGILFPVFFMPFLLLSLSHTHTLSLSLFHIRYHLFTLPFTVSMSSCLFFFSLFFTLPFSFFIVTFLSHYASLFFSLPLFLYLSVPLSLFLSLSLSTFSLLEATAKKDVILQSHRSHSRLKPDWNLWIDIIPSRSIYLDTL